MRSFLRGFFNQRENNYTIPVLNYHHILPAKDKGLCVDLVESCFISTERFEVQMSYLAKQNCVALTLNELERILHGKMRCPKNAVLITFDDGLQSNAIYAYPILKKYSLRATLFIITGRLEPTPCKFDPSKLDSLSWPELREIGDCFEFASHGHLSHVLDEGGAGILCGMSAEEMEADLRHSRELLNTRYFAYPFGHSNEKVVTALQKTGYTLAFSTKNELITPSSEPFALGRFNISDSLPAERFRQILDMKCLVQ